MTQQRPLAKMTAWCLRDLLRRGELSAEQLLSEVYDEIDRREPTVRAFITLRPRKEVLAEATAVDRSRRGGEPVGPLAGIPIALKDNIAVKNTRLTCGSRMLEGYVSPFDATVVNRLRSAGLIIIGKTNLDEFGMGSSTEYSISGANRNPWDSDRVPGGSAAAVVGGETILALGSDTGGSIRQPASLCGCVGLKPSCGRVSRYGLVVYASSLEQIGPVTKDVRDAALLLGLVAGRDRMDSTSLDAPVPDCESELDSDDWQRLIIGVPANLAGLCGISLPCGRTAARLPVGIQLTEPHLQEHRLLRAAHALEQLLAESGDWIPPSVA